MLPREARRLDCQLCVGHAATFICYSSSRLKGPSPVLEVPGESKEVHWLGSIFDFLFIMKPSRTRWSDTTWNYSAIRSNKPVTKSKPGLCWQSSKPTSKINITSTCVIMLIMLTWNNHMSLNVRISDIDMLILNLTPCVSDRIRWEE